MTIRPSAAANAGRDFPQPLAQCDFEKIKLQRTWDRNELACVVDRLAGIKMLLPARWPLEEP